MAADAAAAAAANGLPADASKCLIKVVTDAGKKYTLEVKGDISTLRAEMLKPKLAEKTGVPARKQVSHQKKNPKKSAIPTTHSLYADSEL